MMAKTIKDIEPILDEAKERLQKIYGERLKGLILYGSYARGDATEGSDIDLIIVSQSFKRASFWKRAITLYGYWDPDYPVDFLCFTPEEFEKKTRGVTMVSEAVKECIEVT